ncbi:MAG: NCLDV major capsid protein [Harvfovirus sp.]|uniref:NCLDV major capsid protein n=1 Tax=Harvfovirus sp. TaxID=2487768 RepID=A0A3G5A406_9VIRU|nr:MAG: NCLDV major capsid protein [Harvfovirus sp.]
MAGGLVNIISSGAQDLFLTGTPQITFFKIVYRRYTNFSLESYNIPFDDPTGFGTISNIKIPYVGDLVNKMCLKIVLPSIFFPRVLARNVVESSMQTVICARAEYQRALAFLHVNSNAYRAAMEVFSAGNILNSCEMIEVIIKVFDSFLVSDTAACVNWFRYNSPLGCVDPPKFNLLLIAQHYASFLNSNGVNDPIIMPKFALKNVLDIAMSICRDIQLYYDRLLRDTLLLNSEIIHPNLRFAWVDRIGHAIIDYVDLYIGGDRIDRNYGIWLNIWYELAGNKKQDETYMKMIGNVPELTNFDRCGKPCYSLYVPLQFWFNRFSGLSLPLIALEYFDVRLTIRLRKFQECGYLEDCALSFPERTVNLDNLFENNRWWLDVSLLVDYVFLDRLERKRFAQSSHEYLIDQIQYLKIDQVENPQVQVVLDFVHPCKELIWVLQKDCYTENIDGFTKCRWDNFTFCCDNRGLSMEAASLDFNGYSRFDKFSGGYFNYLQAYEHHTNTPQDGVYVYSFALRPEEHQPTGSCNFSRISKAILNLWISPRMFIQDDFGKHTVTVWIFGINHNIFRIASGIGATVYV